jgi:ABC-2 type transport system permease protein
VLPVVVVLGIAFGSGRGAGGITSLVASISLIAVAMTVLIGPQTMRNDFRQDLANMAVLKSWPIRGPALVRGELLAPTAVLTVVAWLLLAIGAMLFPPAFRRVLDETPFRFFSPMLLAWVVALLAPGLIAAQLLLQNALAVLFPAWIAVGPSRPKGIDAMGQRLLMSAGIVLVLLLSLLPALIVGGVAGAGLYFIAPSWSALQVMVTAAVGGAVMIAECLLAAEWLGRVFDRTDVNAVEAAE